MREFFGEFLLPFASVCAVIAGLTVAIFDVQRAPPPVSSAGPPKVELTPAVIPDTTSRPIPNDTKREQINDVLAHAVRALAESSPRPVAQVSGPGAQPSTAALPVDPGLLGLTSKLSEAVRAARDARDDKDLARAEELMRAARQEMDAVCDKNGGPLCQSAGQIRQLGY